MSASSETKTKAVFQAFQYDLPVLSPDGSKCTIVKLKAGRAKIRRIEKGMLQEAWVPVESLRPQT